MKQLKTDLSLSLFFFFLASPFLQADCILSNNNHPAKNRTQTVNGTITFGQTFIPCEDGYINSITVNTAGGDLKLFLAEGTKDAVMLGTPFQSFTGIPAGNATLALKKAFKVKSGTLYSFAIGNTDAIMFDNMPNSDVHIDGSNFAPKGIQAFLINGSSTNLPPNDLFFEIKFNAQDHLIAPVPTLNQWGYIVFSLLILNLSLIFIKEKNKIFLLRE
jgi:hypothetical protein